MGPHSPGVIRCICLEQVHRDGTGANFRDVNVELQGCIYIHVGHREADLPESCNHFYSVEMRCKDKSASFLHLPLARAHQACNHALAQARTRARARTRAVRSHSRCKTPATMAD